MTVGNGENMKNNKKKEVELPQAVDALFEVNEVTPVMDKEYDFDFLERNEGESMLLVVTRALEQTWEAGADIIGLVLNADDFIALMAETSFQENFQESHAAKLYAGTMHQIFSMKLLQSKQEKSLILLGDKENFDYEKFKKDNDIVDNN